MKLTFENPTVRSTGKVQSFINELKKHPNKWAVYSRTAKHFSYFSGMSSKSDNLVISVRQNPNKKSYTIYMKWLGEAEAKVRRAERQARAKKRAKSPVASKKVANASKRSTIKNKK